MYLSEYFLGYNYNNLIIKLQYRIYFYFKIFLTNIYFIFFSIFSLLFFQIYDLSWLEKLKIVYPLIKFPTENTKMEPFLFIPPDLIKIVGSYKNRTSLYPIFNVDLLIEIPKVN